MGSRENLIGPGGAGWKLDSAARAGIYCLSGCRRMHKGCLQSHSSEWRKGAQEGHCPGARSLQLLHIGGIFCTIQMSGELFSKNHVPLAFTSLGFTK